MNANASRLSSLHWSKISEFILKNDVNVLDHTLNSVNDGLYRVFENKMRDEPLVLRKKVKRRRLLRQTEKTAHTPSCLLQKYKVKEHNIEAKLGTSFGGKLFSRPLLTPPSSDEKTQQGLVQRRRQA